MVGLVVVCGVTVLQVLDYVGVWQVGHSHDINNIIGVNIYLNETM